MILGIGRWVGIQQISSSNESPPICMWKSGPSCLGEERSKCSRKTTRRKPLDFSLSRIFSESQSLLKLRLREIDQTLITTFCSSMERPPLVPPEILQMMSGWTNWPLISQGTNVNGSDGYTSYRHPLLRL